MSKAKEFSALYKDIKQQMGKLVSLCHEVEDHAEATEAHAEVTADAYQRGYETAKHECEDCQKIRYDAEQELVKKAYDTAYADAEGIYESGKRAMYQKGLKDAWECARKIGSNSMCSLKEIGFDFSQCAVSDYNPSWFVVKNYSASEAIEKIRQYEQEQKQLHVGDEVNAPFGKAIVVNIDSVAEKIWLVYADGHGGFEYFKDAPTKTGRHFPELAEVLQKMRETNNG